MSAPTNLGYLFDDALTRAPASPAVFQGEQVITYQQLDERCNRAGNALLALGLRPGDRVHLGTAEFVLQASSAPRMPLAQPMPPLHAREIPQGVLVLRGLGERFAGQAFTLGEHIRIGSAVDARIALDSRYAAAAEADINVMHDCVMIEALSPVSPLVNGYPVRKALLEAGDQIEVRGLRFVLEAPGLTQRNSCEVRAEEAAILADFDARAPQAAASASASSRHGVLVRLLIMALVLAAAITLLLTYPPPI